MATMSESERAALALTLRDSLSTLDPTCGVCGPDRGDVIEGVYGGERERERETEKNNFLIRRPQPLR